MPGTGLVRFLAECSLWLVAVVLLAIPLAGTAVRAGLIAAIPR
jgi:hypothetical protein